ncbi:DUF1194 domain-containing protein [Hyphobacterium sp. HN65]|uniref:DUF1194 domain-containing protein n=1 Tax=Hyphobacterium lacteum TaxID=3116575 RepID=A0ABU7LPH5_9PROT|nr:DUF1194 domain-containing protein [Hyphobacterium sp. HN65]MEE2525816.1 DUF1194 domain-containing protein [Hyphobacterium sp. HN65]
MIRTFLIAILGLGLSAPALSQGFADPAQFSDEELYSRDRQFTEDGRLIVDLELVFAVDVSASIDEMEALQQRQGHVEALADPDIISSIRAGAHGRIAVMYLEWADAGFQRVVAPWTVIETEEDALAFAAILAEADFVSGRRTAIGAAISNAVSLIESNPYQGVRRIIDLSGDGPQNAGPSLPEARAAAEAAGVTVNGISMQSERQHPFRPPVNIDVSRYFEDHVIVGPRSFVMPSRTHEDFVEALRRKLIIEIAGLFPDELTDKG